MICGVIIDGWKLPIFERHLSQSGYTWEQYPFTDGCLILKVKTDNLQTAHIVIRAANDEAAKTGAPNEQH